MAVLFGLMSALAYGVSDFAAGLASRRLDARPVAVLMQALGLITAVAAVLLFPGAGLRPRALEWGAISGLGSALGTLSLYQGLSVARMSVVATLSAVLTAVLPVIVGIALGNHLGAEQVIGVLLAFPAIAMVSWQPGASDPRAARAGVLFGILAGLGFALLFIALDRAGTRSGAWPLLPGQAVSLLALAPFARTARRTGGGFGGRLAGRLAGRFGGRASAGTAALIVSAGVLSGAANLLFLAATGHGQLAIVAVLTALYPAVTVLLARLFLSESWTRIQACGLLAAAAAIVLVTLG